MSKQQNNFELINCNLVHLKYKLIQKINYKSKFVRQLRLVYQYT